MEYIVLVLTVLMLLAAISAVFFKNVVSSLIATMFVSLVVSVLFLFLQAPDVAMTEAAVGAGLTTAIFMIAIKKTHTKEEE